MQPTVRQAVAKRGALVTEGEFAIQRVAVNVRCGLPKGLTNTPGRDQSTAEWDWENTISAETLPALKSDSGVIQLTLKRDGRLVESQTVVLEDARKVAARAEGQPTEAK